MKFVLFLFYYNEWSEIIIFFIIIRYTWMHFFYSFLEQHINGNGKHMAFILCIIISVLPTCLIIPSNRVTSPPSPLIDHYFRNLSFQMHNLKPGSCIV